MGAFRCDACQALSIARATGLPGNQDPLAWLTGKKNVEWLPQPPRVIPTKLFPDVPAAIASAASEAYRCRQIGNANRAAILMARSVIEATAKEKGITTGPLISKIDQMHDQRLIRPDVRNGAHEVRHFGNNMAHGDFVQDVSPQDADMVLALMDAVLTDVYQSPALVAKAKAAREARDQLTATLAAAAAQGKQLTPGLSPQMQALLLQFQATKPPALPRPENDPPAAGSVLLSQAASRRGARVHTPATKTGMRPPGSGRVPGPCVIGLARPRSGSERRHFRRSVFSP
jgi:hypothetical protein